MRIAIRILCIFSLIVGSITHLMVDDVYGVVTVLLTISFWAGCEATFFIDEVRRTSHYR